MRAAVRLLTILCLLWCALGVGEPVPAEGGSVRQETVAVAHLDGGPDEGAVDEGSDGHHHHCPLAPDLPPARAATRVALAAPSPLAARAVALASLTCAPPLEPPAVA